MKKSLLFFFVALLLFSCENRSRIQLLQAEINVLRDANDSLEKRINLVKPGLGELMLGVQIHHNKLWFAGKEGNWALAQYEHDEMLELFRQAEVADAERTEVKMLATAIYPHLDTLRNAILSKDENRFSESFTKLTNGCNNCHKVNKFGFNKIIIPEAPPYTNQEFKPEE
jgi:hypothetical protein